MEDIKSRKRFSKVTTEKEIKGELVIYADETKFVYASVGNKSEHNQVSGIIFNAVQGLFENEIYKLQLSEGIKNWSSFDQGSSDFDFLAEKFTFSDESTIIILAVTLVEEGIYEIDELRQKWAALREYKKVTDFLWGFDYKKDINDVEEMYVFKTFGTERYI